MATYNSTMLTANGGALSGGKTGHGLGGTLKAFYFEVTSTAAVTSSDTINLGYVPKGFRFLAVMNAATDMDSGTTLTWDLGDAGDTDRLAQVSTVGQTNTWAITARAPGASLGHGYKYTADTLITITVVGSPATAAGTFYVTLLGVIEGSAS